MIVRVVEYLFMLALIWWWAGSIGQALNFALLERLQGREARLAFIDGVQRRYDRVLLLPGIVVAGGLFAAMAYFRTPATATLASFGTTWLLNLLSGSYFHPKIYAAVADSADGGGVTYTAAMRAHAVEGVLAFVSGFAFLWFYVARA